MLKLVNRSNESDLKAYCENGAVSAMIYAARDVFKDDNTSAQCWLQSKNKVVCAAISLFEGTAAVYADECADFAELHEFLTLLSPKCVFTHAHIAQRLKLTPAECGEIMEYRGESNEDCIKINAKSLKVEAKAIDPEKIKHLYDIIYGKGASKAKPEAFARWYTDVSHRARHSYIKIISISDKGIPVSAAMTTAQTPRCALIGNVATLPEYQNKGYARSCVAMLTKKLYEENKRVYLLCNKTSPKSLYEKIGFHGCGSWVKISC